MVRQGSAAALNPSRPAPVDAVPFDEHSGGEDAPMWICRFGPDEAGGWGQHRHRQHQIAWVSSGVATVHAGDRSWVIPPTQALWIPSGWPHDIVNRRPARLHCFYVWPERAPRSWSTPTVLAITPMLRELILLLGTDDHEGPVEEAAATLLFSLLEPLAEAPLQLPMPTNQRTRRLAERLLADPSATLTLQDWAEREHTSVSTLRRAFPDETGLTFSEWRRQARLHASLHLLADGMSVERVAARVGYATATGFIDAFRRHFGATPARHARARARD
jgi:AraC-like DNA-binding protein/quercetin dioxygenase-like cupin family protein